VWVWLAVGGRFSLDACHRPRRTTGLTTERDSMFYVVLIIIAIVLGAGLFFVRGRRSV
jgi:hypothetical protein